MDNVKAVAAAAAVQAKTLLPGEIGHGGLMAASLTQGNLEESTVRLRTQSEQQVNHGAPDSSQNSLPLHKNVLINHPVFPVSLQFPDGLLADSPPMPVQLPGKSQLTEVFRTGGHKGAGGPVLHPAHQNSPSVRGKHGLGGIEIQAVVHILHLLPVEIPAIKAANQGNHIVSRVKFQPAGLHVHGTYEQNLPVSQRKEIRTFPHPAQLPVALVQHAHQLPGSGIVAAVEQDLAGAVPPVAGQHRPEAAVRLLPQLRVPEIRIGGALRQVGGSEDGVAFVLFVIDAVPPGDALSLQLRLGSVGTGDPLHAGVHQQVPSIRQRSPAAGKAAHGIIGHVRRQGGGKVLPAHQVGAFGMAPVDAAPVDIVGIALVKQVVFILIERKAVGVVHPAHRTGKMEAGALPG